MDASLKGKEPVGHRSSRGPGCRWSWRRAKSAQQEKSDDEFFRSELLLISEVPTGLIRKTSKNGRF